MDKTESNREGPTNQHPNGCNSSGNSKNTKGVKDGKETFSWRR